MRKTASVEENQRKPYLATDFLTQEKICFLFDMNYH